MSSITSNGSTVSAFFQWSCVQPILWKIWKVVIAVYFLAWLGISIHDYFKDNPAATNALKWLVFLTHWTYLFFTSYLLISAGNACLNYCCHRKNASLGIWVLKLQCFLWNVGAPSTVAVVLLYWSVLWPNRPPPRHERPSVMNCHVHLVNGVIILIDQAFNAMPMNWLHVYQPMVYGGVYAIFTGVYYEANGTDPKGRPAIYPFLNYGTHRKMALSADFGVIFVALPCIWTALWCLHLLRNWIWKKFDRNYHDSFHLNDLAKPNPNETEISTIEAKNKLDE